MKNHLNEFYESKSLSTDHMDDLLALQNQFKEKRKSKRLPLIAGFMTASFLLFTLIQFNGKALEQKIMDEVVYNHNKDMPAEVLTEDYALINDALDKLDFKVIKSQRLANSYQLIGARYCSIQGKIAAQLKLKNIKTNERITLYQFKSRFDAINYQGKRKGTQVDIWAEGDISFALAK